MYRNILRFRRLAVAGTILCCAVAASAAENNYYIHFTSFPPFGSATTSVAAGSPNAAPLSRPADACGVRFEAADSFSWDLPYGLVYPLPSPPAANVWLPSSECSAGGGVWAETYNTATESTSGHYAQPSDMGGMFIATEAKLYWIDAGGNKLIYKHTCNVCGGTKPIYSQATSGSSWVIVFDRIQSVKQALTEMPVRQGITSLIAESERSLQQLSYGVVNAVAQRRSFVAGRLESSVRGLEDYAQAQMVAAAAQLRDCASHSGRGDARAAFLSCDASLKAVGLARAAVDTAENWIE